MTGEDDRIEAERRRLAEAATERFVSTIGELELNAEQAEALLGKHLSPTLTEPRDNFLLSGRSRPSGGVPSHAA